MPRVVHRQMTQMHHSFVEEFQTPPVVDSIRLGHGAWGPVVFVVSSGNSTSMQILHHVLRPPPLPPHLPTVTSLTSPVEAAHPVAPRNTPMPAPIAAYSGIRAAGAGSTNDRRVNAYQRHAVGTRRRPRHGYPTGPASGSAPAVTSQPSSQPNDPAKFSIDLGLLPVALPQAPMWSDETKLEPPPTLNLNDHQIATLQEKLREHNLVLTVEVPPNGLVHAAVNKQIEDFCVTNQFALKPRSSANPNSSSASVANFNWTFYVPLRRAANHTRNFGAKILTADTFTADTLRRAPFGKNVANHTSPRVFAFIGPNFDHLWGPLPGAHDPVLHRCFYKTVMAFLPPFRDDDHEPVCLQGCPRGEIPLENAIASTSSLNVDLYHSDSDSVPPSPSELFPIHRTTTPDHFTIPSSTSVVTASPNAGTSSTRPLLVHSRSPSLELVEAICRPARRPRIGTLSNSAGAVPVPYPQSLASIASRLPAPVPFNRVDGLFVEGWIERVRDVLPPRPSGQEVRISGPDVDACAKVLVFLVTWHFRHPPLLDSQWDDILAQNCPGVQCELVSLSAFLNHRRSFCVGEGIGSGPERAVLSRAIEIASSDVAYWQQGVGHSSLYQSMLLFPSTDSIQTRRTTFATHGFLCLIHMLNIPAAPFPIHPLLLYLVIDGHMAFTIDLPFLQEIDEDLVKTLRPWTSWDRRSSQPLHGQTTELHGLLAACEIPTNCLTDNMGDSELDGIERSMLSYLLFGSKDISHHPDYLAFCHGFNLKISRDVSVLDTFIWSSKGLLAYLYNRRLISPDMLSEHLELGRQTCIDSHTAATSDQRNIGKRFIEHLRRYLLGVGHVEHDWTQPFLDVTDVAAKKHDLLLRSHLLLATLTGSNKIPTADNWSLTFNISYKPFLDTLEVKMPPLMSIHACFHSADVIVDSSFRKILLDALPSNPRQATAFDAWLHLQLIGPDTFEMV
ncbi:hypothetical protein PC9H_008428 [Pleurotus ostreatus]|uniref:Uncharacterized protein n=1 Tax=Pleurotus ostreatus TaxID=5322 RepID=A0A8H7DRL8_PLEOS|nr:uncharacterized protein PC9H_008428 [Pleurotus ostreatus]KAF7426063.1 hypothetical protein PC9H_008428 [Pleurotus ostreatus]